MNTNISCIDGDLLDYFKNSKENLGIAHVCNCKGVMGSGIALAIRYRFPSAYTEYKLFESTHGLALGSVSAAQGPWCPNGTVKYIFNLHAQFNYGTEKKQYLDYDALRQCLKTTQNSLIQHGIGTIGLPYHMGSDRAGGDWDTVLGIIAEELNTVDVVIVKLP